MNLYGQDITQIAFLFMVAVAVGGVIMALIYPMLSSGASAKRVKQIVEAKKNVSQQRQSALSRLLDGGGKDNARRKQVQESLKQIEEREKQRKKRLTLRTLIAQSGLDLSTRGYWVMALAAAAIFAVIPPVVGLPWYVSIGTGIVGGFGFPRWFLNFLRKRRQNKFMNDFADAIDVMVRGLKAGLPVSDAMKVIAGESGPPVGPEFAEVVEGQRVGITIDQGIERMFERMPLSEVNFLGIVMAIQAKTGGNLSEALSNLSKVLRERKKMKQKVKSVSQEAKSSAAIIGALPFVIMLALSVLNPTYMNPLFNTQAGNVLLVGCGTWMGIGVLVMKKMINFDI
jgi:tight adherence protein B